MGSFLLGRMLLALVCLHLLAGVCKGQGSAADIIGVSIKGSRCECHYCRCVHGHVHCQPGYKGGAGGPGLLGKFSSLLHKAIGKVVELGRIALGKHYCYGQAEAEACHCDYCPCRASFGLAALHPPHHPATAAVVAPSAAPLGLPTINPGLPTINPAGLTSLVLPPDSLPLFHVV